MRPSLTPSHQLCRYSRIGNEKQVKGRQLDCIFCLIRVGVPDQLYLPICVAKAGGGKLDLLAHRKRMLVASLRRVVVQRLDKLSASLR